MSDAPPITHDDGPHEGPIRTPKQLILAIFYAFVIPIAVIVLLVMYVGRNHLPAAGSSLMTPEAVSRRIHPVGMVEVKDLTDVAAMKSGEQVFAAQCTACHTAGVAGAPKLGDTAAWAPRIATGYDTLLNSALHGKGAMGPQGGGDYTDLEVGRAVVYLTNKAGGSFEEPKPPAAGASGAETTTAEAAMPAAPVTAIAAPAIAATQAAAEAPVAPPAGGTAVAVPVTAAATATPTTSAATTVAAAPAADAAAPPAVYAQVCQVCHAAGLAGAPKIGDKAAWAPRLALGIDGLTASAIKGKGAMPPKGGSTASDADIKAVVTYMVNAAK